MHRGWSAGLVDAGCGSEFFFFLHGRAAVHLHSQPVNGRVGTQGLQVWGPRGFPFSSEIGRTGCSSTLC